jgi:hypothetical protein
MVTLTTRRNSEAPVIDPEAPVISPAIIADILIAEELPGTFTTVRRENVLVLMLKSVVAFYDWISGPPMTKRDRMYREIAEHVPGLELDRINT